MRVGARIGDREQRLALLLGVLQSRSVSWSVAVLAVERALARRVEQVADDAD